MLFLPMPMMIHMKYVITGGCGFIGSHIARELVRRGHTVTIIDRSRSRRSRARLKGILKKVKIVSCDLRNKALVDRACKGADYILHQGALIFVTESVKKPKLYLDVNINGTRNILEAAKKHRAKRVVFASSAAVYGNTKKLPIKETAKLRPLSPYAVSKVEGERLCRLYWKKHGVPTVILRYFNVFGPGQDPRSQYAGVIPVFISALNKGTRPVVHGDGRQSRDFTYVSNVVDANIAACRAREKKVAGKAFNIADGRAVSVLQLLTKLRSISGCSIKPRFGKPRKGDIRHSLADTGRARRLLGHVPKKSLDAGLKLTVASFF